MKTIVFDLDNTLCLGEKINNSHENKIPNIKMIEILNQLHDEGYNIIIETARNMYTQKNDEGQVIKNVGEYTLKWLRENNVKYDSIRFGKSYGEFYVDDKAIRPSELYKYGLNGVKKIIEEENKNINKILKGE